MSGFDLKKIAYFFPPKKKGSTGLAYCASAADITTSPRHIRKMHKFGIRLGSSAGTIALCNTEIARDTSEVESWFSLEREQSAPTQTNKICNSCLHAARKILENEEG